MTSVSSETKGSPNGKATVNGKEAPELREHDVVCEKGRGDHERWPGNKLYRSLINQYKDSYNDLSPVDRSGIIGKISGAIKEKDGWFVQRDEETGTWGELSEEKVRKKVSDDLRREVRRRREKRSHSTHFSAKLKALKEVEEMNELEGDILQPVDEPRQSDVLFGPGARRHAGNKTYWRLMKTNLDHYIISPYGARSMISRSIVEGIRERKGRFLEQDPKTAIWYEISDKRAIEKTSHALSNKKYKSRKRNGEEDDQPPLNDIEDAESDCSSAKGSEPSQESGESQTRAKVMSKKFRLLQRMVGPEFDDDDKESIPHAANILVMGFPRAVEEVSKLKQLGAPRSPPMSKPAAEEHHAIISPNDSRASVSDESRDDYQEHESGAFRRVAKRLPSVPEATPAHEYVYRKADIGPRLSHYEYMEEERYLSERLGYVKSHPHYVGRPHAEFTPIRRYAERGPLAPRHIQSHHHSPAHIPHHAAGFVTSDRHELESPAARSPPGGYWVRDWGAGRPAEEYRTWR
eukprot:Nitzschia sp. Nitz4//scaffold44_size153857//82100//83656//NITZ4_002727-RA/size153857-processed-gene-0.127-mRNA-1//1//CDS//3329552175//1189//frame0